MVRKIIVGGAFISALLLSGSEVKAAETYLETNANYKGLEAKTLVVENEYNNAKLAKVNYERETVALGIEMGLTTPLSMEGQGYNFGGRLRLGSKKVNIELMPEYSFFHQFDLEHDHFSKTRQFLGKLNLKGENNKVNVGHQISEMRNEVNMQLREGFWRRVVRHVTNVNYEFLNKGTNFRITGVRKSTDKLEDAEVSLDVYKKLIPGTNLEFIADYAMKNYLEVEHKLDVQPAIDVIMKNNLMSFGINYSRDEGEFAGVQLRYDFGKDIVNSKKFEKNLRRTILENKGFVQQGVNLETQLQDRYSDAKARLSLPISVEGSLLRSFQDKKRIEWHAKAMAGTKTVKLFAGFDNEPFEYVYSGKAVAGFYVNAKQLQVKGQYEHCLEWDNKFSIKINYGGLTL